MKAKVLVLFYSAYGHIYRMAEAVAEGARQVEGVEVDIKQVPRPSQELREDWSCRGTEGICPYPVASVDDLLEYDAIIFGAPTRYGLWHRR